MLFLLLDAVIFNLSLLSARHTTSRSRAISSRQAISQNHYEAVAISINCRCDAKRLFFTVTSAVGPSWFVFTAADVAARFGADVVRERTRRAGGDELQTDGRDGAASKAGLGGRVRRAGGSGVSSGVGRFPAICERRGASSDMSATKRSPLTASVADG